MHFFRPFRALWYLTIIEHTQMSKTVTTGLRHIGLGVFEWFLTWIKLFLIGFTCIVVLTLIGNTEWEVLHFQIAIGNLPSSAGLDSLYESFWAFLSRRFWNIFKHGCCLPVKKRPHMDENMKNGFTDPDLHIQFFISDQYKQRFMAFTL